MAKIKAFSIEKKFPMSEKDFKHFVAIAVFKACGAALDGVHDRFKCRYNTYFRESFSLPL